MKTWKWFLLCAVLSASVAVGVNTALPLIGSKVLITQRTAGQNGTNTGVLAQVYLPTDGGFLTTSVGSSDVLRMIPPVTCTRAIGAVDAGACADSDCAYSGAEVGSPCLLGTSTAPSTDMSVFCYVGDAGQVEVRACCGRHFGNTGTDCAAVAAQPFQLRLLPK